MARLATMSIGKGAAHAMVAVMVGRPYSTPVDNGEMRSGWSQEQLAKKEGKS